MRRIFGNLIGTSQKAGTLQPAHTLLVDSSGAVLESLWPPPLLSAWTAVHFPAANVRATITKAAAGVGKRNICTHLTVMLAGGSAAPTAINLQVNLIDGVSGGVAYLWGATLSLPATAGAATGIATPVWCVGSANTAMTLEFTVAGGLNTIESVSMGGTAV